ncbi:MULTISPECIES: CapA family protein [unclassified Microbulbifer]|uniref:CapA family protein n=1 Tax=unclassified Microbulbifer TaxID=2619833 RepID=UPI0027E48BBD|nr:MULTISPECIES: CapA family protein [unclassified Microbulbifer]
MSEETVRLILAGDVMTGRGVDQILPHPSPAQIYEPYMRSAQGYVALAEQHSGPIPQPAEPAYLWGDALAAMDARAPDFRIINLETAVTRSEDYWPGKGINYRMHPDNVSCLEAARIDACGLANNHVLDWGYEGLAETVATLRNADIETAGAGENSIAAGAPAVLSHNSRRVLLFAFGHPSSGVPDEWRARADKPGVNVLQDLSEKSAQQLADEVDCYRRPGDLTVMSIHWGGNWGYRIAQAQRDFAHALIDHTGVDLVFGHSSHHPQGNEIYRERAVLYGCGDLINDYEGIGGHEEYRSQLRLLYCVDLDRDSGALRRLELIPFEMYRFRLRRVSAEQREWLHRTLKRECRRLGSELIEDRDSGSLLLRWPGVE